jgi:hypothetical protein
MRGRGRLRANTLRGARSLVAPTVAVLACIATALPSHGWAEVIIELTDGERITIPVDGSRVERITLLPGGDGAHAVRGSQSGPPTAPPPASTRATPSVQPTVWRVGPRRAIKRPSEVARRAGNGDVVEIDAGTYRDDYATWGQDGLTIRAVGGIAHLKSSGLIPNGKAIWIVRGHDTVIEHVEFSGAAVAHTNGAGIRHEGGDLTLRNAFFHDNEFSILSGRLPGARITIESSRFWHQKRPSRFSHGIYIGDAARLTLVGNHFLGTDQDVPGGNSSRLLDLPSCGFSLVIGNDMHQAATSGNFNAIGYGTEGCGKRSGRELVLLVVNNTFVNEAPDGSLVRNFAAGDVLVANNVVLGAGTVLVGEGRSRNNVQEGLASRAGKGWHVVRGSAAIDGAAVLDEAGGVSLVPTREFAAPFGTSPRPRRGVLDAGSREAVP